ncbi:helix-turn-helix transcriptional regulator [Mesorhizobium sp. B3-1-9]|uniref:helix-turn-helix domain-containing protein n=1 Tax=Mesorhizobium sp. B3-1-9 TaxID=2589892 RepID=UPI00112E4832|nr:helix-turn-helix transcriptional regulator [Mesorhizobium sp. B3-1-9]TPI36300.1 helix-turn-helix transcriptional regulator [Mesorhizobium sp. B3-1-9]
MENVRDILATNLRLARQRVGISQEDLADLAASDRTYVSGIERGVRNPTITVVARFAAALKTTSAMLLTKDAYLPGKQGNSE